MAAMGLQSGSAFPETRNIRYPTPGTILPSVLLHVLDVSNVTDIKRHIIQPPVGTDGQWVAPFNRKAIKDAATGNDMPSRVEVWVAGNWLFLGVVVNPLLQGGDYFIWEKVVEALKIFV